MAENEDTYREWRYHATIAPEGKIFTRRELEGLDESWVDSPAKLVSSEEEVPTTDPPVDDPPVVPASDNATTPEYSPNEVIARALLSGEGLNHSSFTRALGLDSKKPVDRKKTRPEYDAILEKYKDKIKKQGNDWFWTESE